MSHLSTCMKTPGCNVEQTAKEHAALKLNTYINESFAFSIFILLPVLVLVVAKYGPRGFMKLTNKALLKALSLLLLLIILLLALPLTAFIYGYGYRFDACYNADCSVVLSLAHLVWPICVLSITLPLSILLLRKTIRK